MQSRSRSVAKMTLGVPRRSGLSGGSDSKSGVKSVWSRGASTKNNMPFDASHNRSSLGRRGRSLDKFGQYRTIPAKLWYTGLCTTPWLKVEARRELYIPASRCGVGRCWAGFECGQMLMLIKDLARREAANHNAQLGALRPGGAGFGRFCS